MTGNESVATDVVDAVLGQAADAVAPIRRQRPAVIEHTQGSYDALFSPDDAGGFIVEHRFAVALRVAALAEQDELVAHYRAGVSTATARAMVGGEAVADPRLAALVAHADLLTTGPAEASPAALNRLSAAGFSTADIVAAGQLIAFVNYQLRVVAGLRLIGEAQ